MLKSDTASVSNVTLLIWHRCNWKRQRSVNNSKTTLARSLLDNLNNSGNWVTDITKPDVEICIRLTYGCIEVSRVYSLYNTCTTTTREETSDRVKVDPRDILLPRYYPVKLTPSLQFLVLNARSWPTERRYTHFQHHPRPLSSTTIFPSFVPFEPDVLSRPLTFGDLFLVYGPKLHWQNSFKWWLPP